MNLIKISLFLSISLAIAFRANAETFKGFVKVNSGKELYVEWSKAKADQPTVVLLNGLTYSTVQWDRFSDELTKKGYGVFRYDPYGMGQTLLKYAPILEPVQIDDQIADLKSLLKEMGLKAPYNFVGLSYGGGMAMKFAQEHPGLVKRMILMAPFTQPVEEQDSWIRSQVWYTRKVNPYNPYSDEELYDFFLHQIVYSTYPSAEPIVLENPFKLESTFRMVQGIRHWNAAMAVGKFPAKSVHLMIAGMDQYIKRHVMDEFWAIVPETAKASLIVVQNSEHKIPEAVPRFSAAWVIEILKGNKVLSTEKIFEGDPRSGKVNHSSGSFIITKDN